MNGIFDGFWNHWNTSAIVVPLVKQFLVVWIGYLHKSWKNPFAESRFSIVQVALGGNDVSINTKVGDNVILWLLVLILLELPWRRSLGEASFIGVTSWDWFLLGKNPWSFEWFLGILQVAGGGDDISIDTEVWDDVIFWLFILVLLEFPWACGFSAATFIGIACWDRSNLNKGWNDPGTKFGFSILQVGLGGNDVSINTEVWYNVVFWLFVLILLEFPWWGSLGEASFISVAGWDWLLLGKSWNDPVSFEWFLSILEVVGGCDDVSIDSEVWYNVIFWMLVLILLEFPWACGFSAATFIGIACWDWLLLSKGWDDPLCLERSFGVL